MNIFISNGFIDNENSWTQHGTPFIIRNDRYLKERQDLSAQLYAIL